MSIAEASPSMAPIAQVVATMIEKIMFAGDKVSAGFVSLEKMPTMLEYWATANFSAKKTIKADALGVLLQKTHSLLKQHATMAIGHIYNDQIRIAKQIDDILLKDAFGESVNKCVESAEVFSDVKKQIMELASSKSAEAPVGRSSSCSFRFLLSDRLTDISAAVTKILMSCWSDDIVSES